MVRKPQPSISWPLQLAHLLLFCAAVFCAICLRGNILVMYGTMIAALCAMLLSLIPYRFLPPLIRQVLQLAIGAGAIAWAHHQLMNAPIDMILIEVAAMLGVALMIGRNAHEYSLLFFISIGFLGYGGLMPGRPYFLHVFTGSAILILHILYKSRINSMIKLSPDDDPIHVKYPRLGHSWRYYIVHALLVIAVILLMLRHLPQTQALKTKGLIPVSFSSEQDVLFPELWKRWHQPASRLVGGDAENTGGNQEDLTQKASLQADFDASKIVDMAKQPAFDSRGGSGFAFGTGDKLVFRAVSPAKLYWVVQMYDDYDGNTWRCSPSMLSGRTGPDRFVPVHEVEVPQHISMERPTSNKLPYAYRFRQVNFRQSINRDVTLIRANSHDPFSITLRTNKLPAPPWRYRVQSFVPNPEIKKPLRAWREPLRNNGWNYRRLPASIISDRLRALAGTITEGADSPFDKAVRIRDYLRNNCTYTLQPPPIPEDKEVVDFFLFESKQGYCQHFAQAFTVLARLAGLHSRLVTGYAPGNYNLLTNTFEVYEYHAHAWTHIFAEPYGWLTFDGVAPANLNLQNTPALLTDLMDPFGEEWNARPPELTYIPPPPPSQSMKEKPNSNPEDSFAGKVYEKAATDNQTTEPNAAELGKAAVQIASQSLAEKATAIWQKITQTVLKSWEAVKNVTYFAIYAFKNMTPLDMVAATFCLIVCMTAYMKRKTAFRILAFLHQIYLCRRNWFSLEYGKHTPTERILICHDVSTRLLKLAGFARPPSKDLVEWVDIIAESAPELAQNYRPIALATSRIQFDIYAPSVELASDIAISTSILCRQLSPFISQSLAQSKK